VKKNLMIKDVILKMIIYFGNDIKRINHALKVYGFVTFDNRLSDLFTS